VTETLIVGQRVQLKHVAVREYVRDLVEGAEPGTPAPSERELVQRFGVARMTVRQAMDTLVAEGLLERVPGRGTFVAEPRSEVGRLTGYTEDMTRRGSPRRSWPDVRRPVPAWPGRSTSPRATR
jgi:GntR family transcriptional regulator